jgi:hypothetical protein
LGDRHGCVRQGVRDEGKQSLLPAGFRNVWQRLHHGRTPHSRANRELHRDKDKRGEGVVHMIASCATDIMYSNVQFSVKVLGENKISRIFPGIEGSGSEIRRLKRDEDRRRLIVHHRIS